MHLCLLRGLLGPCWEPQSQHLRFTCWTCSRDYSALVSNSGHEDFAPHDVHCSTHCTAQETHALVADIDRRMLIDRTQWTLQQNRDVISALKRENKELKDSLKTQPLPEKQQVRGLGCLVIQGDVCLLILQSHCETASPQLRAHHLLCAASAITLPALHRQDAAVPDASSCPLLGMLICLHVVHLVLLHISTRAASMKLEARYTPGIRSSSA